MVQVPNGKRSHKPARRPVGFLVLLAVVAFFVFSCMSGGTAGDPGTPGALSGIDDAAGRAALTDGALSPG